MWEKERVSEYIYIYIYICERKREWVNIEICIDLSVFPSSQIWYEVILKCEPQINHDTHVAVTKNSLSPQPKISIVRFLPSCGCVSTTVWLHHLDDNETPGEKARRELHNNDRCCSEQILEASPPQNCWCISSHKRSESSSWLDFVNEDLWRRLSMLTAGILITDSANAGLASPATATAVKGLVCYVYWGSLDLPSATFLPEVGSAGILKGGDDLVDGAAPGLTVSSKCWPLVVVNVACAKGLLEGVFKTFLWRPSVTVASGEFIIRVNKQEMLGTVVEVKTNS